LDAFFCGGDFLSEVGEVFLCEPSLKEGAGIHARCAVWLQKNQIASVLAFI